MQCPGRRYRPAGGWRDVERIGEAVFEAAAALVSVAVAHAHLIGELCMSRRNKGLWIVDDFVVIRSLLVIDRKVKAGSALLVIDEEGPVGRGQQLQLTRKCRLALRTFDIHVKRSVERKYAIVADAVALEIVGHAQRIAVYAGVHLIVARDRDVERMSRVTPYVEVRRIVLTQVNAVVEDAAAPCGADHQVRSARRGVVGGFVPLVRNRRYRALRVLEEVLHARTAAPRGVGKLHERSVGEILLRGRRSTRRREGRRMAGDGTQAYGAQFEVGDLIRYADVVGDLGHGAPHAQCRKRNGPFIGRDRNGHDGRHGKRRILLLPLDRIVEELLRTPLAQVRTQVGSNVEIVLPGQALEPHQRRTGVKMQALAVAAAEQVEVDVADRLLVRRAGRKAKHIFGRNTQFGRDRTFRGCAIDRHSHFPAARAQQQIKKRKRDCSEHRNRFF